VPGKDDRGVDLISDVLPFGRLRYGEPGAISNAIGAKFYSRSHDAVIRVYDEASNVIETHEHAGEFKVFRSARRVLRLNQRKALGQPDRRNSADESRARCARRCPA
jgi:hypothetical protein